MKLLKIGAFALALLCIPGVYADCSVTDSISFTVTPLSCVQSVTDSIAFTVTPLSCVQSVTDSISFTVTPLSCVQSVTDSIAFSVIPVDSSGSGSTDTGSGTTDSGTGSTDSGTGTTDSGTGTTDTGSGTTNSGTGTTDSGSGSTQTGSTNTGTTLSSSSGGGGGSSSKKSVISSLISVITPTTSENTQTQNESTTSSIPVDDVSAVQESKIREYAQKILNEHSLLLESLKEQEKEEVGETFLQKLPEELPRTGTPLTERVKVYGNAAVETKIPTGALQLTDNTNTNLNHWIEVLPEQDKNRSKYLVVPSSGLVIPVGEYDSESQIFQTMINGQEADVMPALQKGALEYPGTSQNGYGEAGNKVIFGHSSYFTKDVGRYKTHFQKIIELDVGEEIWVYEKESSGEFQRYVYVTEASYNTHPKDVEVLLSGKGKHLTLFTCTPVGGIEGRWIIKAKYKEENALQTTELSKKINFQDIPVSDKIKLYKVLKKIPDEKLSLAFEKVLKAKQEKKISSRTSEYIELQLAKRLLKK